MASDIKAVQDKIRLNLGAGGSLLGIVLQATSNCTRIEIIRSIHCIVPITLSKSKQQIMISNGGRAAEAIWLMGPEASQYVRYIRWRPVTSNSNIFSQI